MTGSNYTLRPLLCLESVWHGLLFGAQGSYFAVQAGYWFGCRQGIQPEAEAVETMRVYWCVPGVRGPAS